jgi:indolepyruvate ferredoxin oxidoreductase alpha subunit
MGIETNKSGSVERLIGNEAIARGALEAGIGVASAYPGTLSSEIITNLGKVAKKMDLCVEWSIKEE